MRVAWQRVGLAIVNAILLNGVTTDKMATTGGMQMLSGCYL